jgi:hypothetical protein
VDSIPLIIMAVMAEDKDTRAPKQGKGAGKRMWPRGAPERTLRRKIWDRRGLRKKTLWDWLQLLIVPLALALIGLMYTTGQQAEQQNELEQRSAQEAAFQTYLDVMRDLPVN